MPVKSQFSAILERLGLMSRPAPVVFYIFAPPYTYMSSGIRCLHLLCDHLNRLGYRAYLNTRRTSPKLNTPFADWKTIERF
jgi:hypothetical protein